MTEGHIFISYAWEDGASYADRLFNWLVQNGATPWMDRSTNAPTRWAIEIRNKLDTAIGVIMLQSPSAARSPWVDREIRRATAAGIPVLGLLIEGPPYLVDGVGKFFAVHNHAMPDPALLEALSVLPARSAAQGGSGGVGDFYRGMDVSRADLSADDLSEADFDRSDLAEATLRSAAAPRSTFDSARLARAELSDCDLRGMRLTNADLRAANMSRADLRGVDLSGANLERANLTGANLTGANISHAIMTDALTDGAIWDGCIDTGVQWSD